MWLSRIGLLVLTISSCWPYCNAISGIVEFPELGASTKCYLPRERPLKVTIKTEHLSVDLKLTRSKGVDENTPVYVSRKSNGRTLFVRKNLSERKDTGVYQDRYNKAEFEVSCHRDENSDPLMVLNGTLKLSDGKMYSLKQSNTSRLFTLEEETIDTSDLGNDAIDDGEINPVDEKHIGSAERRVKREIPDDVFIDVFPLIEYSVYQRWFSRSTESTDELKKIDTLDSIRRHFVHLFNAINLRFKTASSRININLVGFLIDDEATAEWFENVRSQESDKTLIDAKKILDASYEFSKTLGFPIHDHIVSFTTENLYGISNGTVNANVAGLAYVAQICRENGKSVSTLEYKDVFSTDVRRAAHEIGHCLSAQHDGTTGDNGNSCSASDNFIMNGSPQTFTSTNPFTFSSCSATYFDGHINSLLNSGKTYSTECLLNSLQEEAVPNVGIELPGEIYTLDEQCVMANGAGSSHCSSFDISDSSVCLKMWCSIPGTNSCNRRYAAWGTQCGENKWCEGGQCVDKDDHVCRLIKTNGVCATYWGDICCI